MQIFIQRMILKFTYKNDYSSDPMFEEELQEFIAWKTRLDMILLKPIKEMMLGIQKNL